jgi:hypothetical protein
MTIMSAVSPPFESDARDQAAHLSGFMAEGRAGGKRGPVTPREPKAALRGSDASLSAFA